MNDEIGDLVKRLLDENIDLPLSDKAEKRLESARKLALDAYQKRCNNQQQSPCVHSPTNGSSFFAAFLNFLSRRGYILRQTNLILVLLLSIGFLLFINEQHHINNLADIDSRLLTDGLPIDAFTDKDFDVWLKSISGLHSS